MLNQLVLPIPKVTETAVNLFMGTFSVLVIVITRYLNRSVSVTLHLNDMGVLEIADYKM